jgi:H+/Cl- antiporter ClcA
VARTEGGPVDGGAGGTRPSHLGVVVEQVRWTALGVVVGLLAGLSSAAFLATLGWATDTRIDRGWLIFLLPAAGLVVGLAYHHLGGRAAGGTVLILDEIGEPTAWVPRRMAPLVFAGTVLTHLVGGSAGREGTAIQMSGSLTDLFARIVRLGHRDRVVLLVAAVSGGFGAVFGVPLAGCVFGLEVRGSERGRHAAVLPSLVASVVGDRVVRGLGVHHTPLPRMDDVHLDAALAAKLAVAGVAFGIAALAFHESTVQVKRWCQRRVRWAPARPVLGAVVVLALVAVAGTRAYLGLSVPLMVASAAGGVGIVGAAFAWKVGFTAVTLGTGFPGGEVTPLFVIGATLGVTMARLLHAPVALFAAVGLVAVFSAAANTPLACTVMAVELFGPAALVPAAIVCVAARVASTDRSIYGSASIDRPAPGYGRPREPDR